MLIPLKCHSRLSFKITVWCGRVVNTSEKLSKDRMGKLETLHLLLSTGWLQEQIYSVKYFFQSNKYLLYYSVGKTKTRNLSSSEVPPDAHPLQRRDSEQENVDPERGNYLIYDFISYC